MLTETYFPVTEIKTRIATNKANGFTGLSFETPLACGEYTATSKGLFRDKPVTSAKGAKFLFLYALVEREINDGLDVEELEITINESDVDLLNDGEVFYFEVYRKDGDAKNPKRFRIISELSGDNIGETKETNEPKETVETLTAKYKAAKAADKPAIKAQIDALKALTI